MANTDRGPAPLAAAAGAAGPHATAAFALLGNETRLAILLALWESYDPHADDNTVPFSELFDRVDYDDPGNFSYHLEKLEGQFVQQQADREGYELRGPGLQLVRVVIAGAGVQDVTRAPAEIDQPCPCCGAPTEISYREGLVVQCCTECEGPTPTRTDVAGFLNAVPFDPAGLANRSPESLRAASRVAGVQQMQAMFQGLCLTCSGPVESWLECCPDHGAAGGCETCGTEFVAWARFRCRVCKAHTTSSPKALALLHPEVVAFYADHGVSTRIHAEDFERVTRLFDLLDDHEMDRVSVEPPRVDVTASLDGDEIVVTFDETVSVVDVCR